MAEAVPQIYLDYAATAPLLPEARRVMEALLDGPLSGIFAGAGNANALSSAGRAAFQTLEAARGQIAGLLGASRPSEIVFTSSATEADNTALAGLALAARKRRGGKLAEPKVILSALEHDAVRKTKATLRELGFTVEELRPDADGFIEMRTLARALTDETLLVSVQTANSEVGSIQPIAQLAALAHQRGALFHTDAVQALGKTPIDLGELAVDAASFSAHKIGGPYGIAALYLRHGTPFRPLIVGGGQEAGRRSGTQNVVGAVGFAAALEATLTGWEAEADRLRALRDRLYGALGILPGVEAAVDVDPGSRDYLPTIATLLFDGLESETLVLRYDALGFAVSGGSACSSASLEPSYALRALGIPPDRARGELRVSMGRETSAEEVEAFIEATPRIMEWRQR